MPPIKEKSYYFGRLNIIGVYENKEDYVRQSFTNGSFIEKRGVNWTFLDFSELRLEEDLYFHGFLAKYKDEYYERINAETSESEMDLNEDRVIAKARFFLHVKSGLIAYHRCGNQINIKQFRNIFCKLFEESHQRLFVQAHIEAINDRGEFFEEIGKLDSLKRIRFKLQPSNPNNNPLWDDVDEDLKKLGASRYSEEYRSKPNESLDLEKIKNDRKFTSKIYMSLDGYGETIADGEINQKPKRLSSQENPTYKTVIEKNDFREVFDQLSDKMKEILDRFKKKPGGALPDKSNHRQKITDRKENDNRD